MSARRRPWFLGAAAGAAGLVLLAALPAAAARRQISPPLRFTAATAGARHTCALTPAGEAWCWGDDRFGQLGAGGARERCGARSGVPGRPCATRPVPVATGIRFAVLSAGTDHTCGLSRDWQLYCWGLDDADQLGVGGLVERCIGSGRGEWVPCTRSPVPVRTRLRFVTLGAGRSHTCALTAGGVPFCWGSIGALVAGAATVDEPCQRRVRQRHDGSERVVCAATPTALATPRRFVAVNAEYLLDQDGNVYLAASPPGPVAGRVRLTRLGAGPEGPSCGLSADGIPYCWTRGSAPQVPGATAGDRVAAPPLHVVAIGTLAGAGCALDEAGMPYCWPIDAAPRAPGGRWRIGRPQRVPGAAAGFRTLATGGRHACALDGAGAALCWGANEDGQLGAGDARRHGRPVMVRDRS